MPPSIIIPDFGGNLINGINLASKARQQDFTNSYTGSEIAPQWTAMLQGLKDAGVGRISQGPGGLSADLGIDGTGVPPISGDRKRQPSPYDAEAAAHALAAYPGVK